MVNSKEFTCLLIKQITVLPGKVEISSTHFKIIQLFSYFSYFASIVLLFWQNSNSLFAPDSSSNFVTLLIFMKYSMHISTTIWRAAATKYFIKSMFLCSSSNITAIAWINEISQNVLLLNNEIDEGNDKELLEIFIGTLNNLHDILQVSFEKETKE